MSDVVAIQGEAYPCPTLTETSNERALVVGLDGTLILSEMLYESFLASSSRGPKHFWSALVAAGRGKAQLKAYLAGAPSIDYGLLPFNPEVLQLVRQAKQQGRSAYLATESDRVHADGIAAHLGLFDGVFSSDEYTNVAGEGEARLLAEVFGYKGFDYVGNSATDLSVWKGSRRAYVVGASSALLHKVQSLGVEVIPIGMSRLSLGDWLKALRVHQYAKNSLIFVPLLTAHTFSTRFIFNSLLAFFAFCLCASSAYLLNDLIDLRNDRLHPAKRMRPIARGAIPIYQVLVAAPILLSVALFCANAISIPFSAVLLAYVAITLAYSLTLKRRLMVDVVVLATLYTTRVIAGAAALPVIPSEWLLAFSMLVFTCLALVKRYVELALRIDRDLPDPSNRNYRLSDLPIIGALAAASGINAITIFALYVSSPTVSQLYRHPQLLWLLCAILMYWLSRIVILAHRRVVDDDPIIFALRDRNSQICAVCMVAIVLLAI
ncbi:MAG TPA: UbiA family prenyltransferase [Bryobacteraceae bacterium]|nr:UbiA family prenyltransferase [Bryobacteraceae bacterium]